MAMKNNSKDHTAKLLNKVKYPLEYATCFGFLIWEKFLPGSDDELTEQLLVWSVCTGCTDSDEN